MTPQETAEDLVDRFYNEVKYMERAKKCALIAVDEILESNMTNLHLHQIDYYQEVKQEIEKL
jgi:hypothetical protein